MSEFEFKGTIYTDLADSLRSQGFEAGAEAGNVVFTSMPDFTVEDMKAAAFDTRHSNPKTIPVKLHRLGTVQVAITTLRLTFQERDDEEVTGYYETPNWYLEGWIVDGTSTHHDQRVRAYVYSDGPNETVMVEEVEAQVIPERPHPTAHIRYARESR
ncbi:hypothetical protein [Amycolatopsis sp. cmx-8-4]|uniref:hypothetical protein n=1 Tax=Amycolatopsis sp. cmx-8-4 TaxID=2790947 RepID=UPI00397BBBCD